MIWHIAPRRNVMPFLLAVLSGILGTTIHGIAAEQPAIPAETPAAARLRHERIAQRRNGIDIICHRGASEHAHENTLEAYRATFELGGDGNEIDIRATKDGVLVCFHDDMLDVLLEAYGSVSDYDWDQLQRFRFRRPGWLGAQCRIPTLVEVFDLHRRYAGLIHLDIKRPGLDRDVAQLLTRMDMWDHVAYCNDENSATILRNPRAGLRGYKGGLFADRSDVFPEAIAAMLSQPGNGVIVDDPRGVAVALGRKLGKVSTDPVSPHQAMAQSKVMIDRTVAELIATLRDADEWNEVAAAADEQASSARRIRARAEAAEQLLAMGAASPEVFAAAEQRVRQRSLHKDWMYHGLDGAMALRLLILLRAPNAIETARFTLWRDDPDLEPIVDPRWNSPRAWTDFRVKMVIFPALEQAKVAADVGSAENLCRDFLALSDQEARGLGPPDLFEQAARALFAISPRKETALELLQHRLRVVRGRTILVCLARSGEPWARTALQEGAPHALAYLVEN